MMETIRLTEEARNAQLKQKEEEARIAELKRKEEEEAKIAEQKRKEEEEKKKKQEEADRKKKAEEVKKKVTFQTEENVTYVQEQLGLTANNVNIVHDALAKAQATAITCSFRRKESAGPLFAECAAHCATRSTVH